MPFKRRFETCELPKSRWLNSIYRLPLEEMLTIRRARQEDCQSIGDVHSAAVSGIRTDLYTAEEIRAWAVPKKPESYEEYIHSREFFVAEEGEVIPTHNALVQVRNTDRELPWLTSYIETALLRAVWYPTTVATLSFEAKRVISRHEFLIDPAE